jgi:tRNA threonylcarbamoyladenosine modification (KEOPS) complex Cgi121 subunit
MKLWPDVPAAAAGATGTFLLEDVLFMAAKANRIAPTQVVRADRVVGERHVWHAAALATRALREGRAQADRLEVEFTRYLAGERQIRAALDKVGVRDGETDLVVVALGLKAEDAVRYMLHALAAKREDDAVMAASESKLVDFGIKALELEATTPERRLDIIFERVAEVDVLRS